MNFNASPYDNGVSGMTKEFEISAQAAKCGAMVSFCSYPTVSDSP